MIKKGQTINVERVTKGLEEIRDQLQVIVDEAELSVSFCCQENQRYIITWGHIQTLNQIIGRGD